MAGTAATAGSPARSLADCRTKQYRPHASWVPRVRRPHRRLAVDRCPDRKSCGLFPGIGSTSTKRRSARSTIDPGLAISPRTRRQQNREVSPDNGAATSLCGCLGRPSGAMDPSQPRLRVRTWRAAGRCQRPAVVPSRRQGPWPGRNGLDARELRHGFVSLLSSSGVPIEDLSRLVGHVSTNVTEKAYRHELRPVMTKGPRRRTKDPSPWVNGGRNWSLSLPGQTEEGPFPTGKWPLTCGGA
jgi:hypothetical protein